MLTMLDTPARTTGIASPPPPPPWNAAAVANRPGASGASTLARWWLFPEQRRGLNRLLGRLHRHRPEGR